MPSRGFRPQAPELWIQRLRGGSWATASDPVAAEEPLQIRLDGRPLSVVMRTPGADVELALGLLWAERVVRSLAEVERLAISAESEGSPPDLPPGGPVVVADLLESNTIDVVRRPGAGSRPRPRAFVTSSACGVCGSITVDELARDWPAIPAGPVLAWDLLGHLPGRLRASQELYRRTGGLHGAALFTPAGELVLGREDVGRHNAVDKIVGRLLLDGALPATGGILAVSGRAGFEIVQKAVAAGFCAVVAVGAPSSLAVATARRFDLTLIGFAAPDRGNVYAGADRVADLALDSG